MRVSSGLLRPQPAPCGPVPGPGAAPPRFLPQPRPATWAAGLRTAGPQAHSARADAGRGLAPLGLSFPICKPHSAEQPFRPSVMQAQPVPHGGASNPARDPAALAVPVHCGRGPGPGWVGEAASLPQLRLPGCPRPQAPGTPGHQDLMRPGRLDAAWSPQEGGRAPWLSGLLWGVLVKVWGAGPLMVQQVCSVPGGALPRSACQEPGRPRPPTAGRLPGALVPEAPVGAWPRPPLSRSPRPHTGQALHRAGVRVCPRDPTPPSQPSPSFKRPRWGPRGRASPSTRAREGPPSAPPHFGSTVGGPGPAPRLELGCLAPSGENREGLWHGCALRPEGGMAGVLRGPPAPCRPPWPIPALPELWVRLRTLPPASGRPCPPRLCTEGKGWRVETPRQCPGRGLLGVSSGVVVGGGGAGGRGPAQPARGSWDLRREGPSWSCERGSAVWAGQGPGRGGHGSARRVWEPPSRPGAGV